MGYPGGATGKEPTCQCWRHERCGFNLWVGKIPWMRKWKPTLVFMPGESYGPSLGGYSPLGHKELDTTEWLILSLFTEAHALQAEGGEKGERRDLEMERPVRRAAGTEHTAQYVPSSSGPGDTPLSTHWVLLVSEETEGSRTKIYSSRAGVLKEKNAEIQK